MAPVPCIPKARPPPLTMRCVSPPWCACVGWRSRKGGHVLFHTVERASATTVHFGVCNTGDGLNYHPVSLQCYPKVVPPSHAHIHLRCCGVGDLGLLL